MNEKRGFVYIMSNKKNGTLYVGVTNDLARRVYEHKHHLAEGFTSKYGLDRLVWFDSSESIEAALISEKKVKNRSRAYKIDLIEKSNPNWRDLSAEFMDSAIRLRRTQNDGGVAGASASFAQNDGEVVGTAIPPSQGRPCGPQGATTPSFCVRRSRIAESIQADRGAR